MKAAIPRLMAAFFVLMTALIAWTLLANSEVTDNYRDRLWIGIFPVLAFVAVIVGVALPAQALLPQRLPLVGARRSPCSWAPWPPASTR